jgi:small subunit ribosomal protein S6
MNCYEYTFIARQDLAENQNEKILEKYQEIINNNSGKTIKTEEWGLRPLSYKIKNNRRWIYFHIKFEGIGKTIDELERVGNIDQLLIRYLTVKVKKHDLETTYFEKK